jgi:hypothetical protein
MKETLRDINTAINITKICSHWSKSNWNRIPLEDWGWAYGLVFKRERNEPRSYLVFSWLVVQECQCVFQKIQQFFRSKSLYSCDYQSMFIGFWEIIWQKRYIVVSATAWPVINKEKIQRRDYLIYIKNTQCCRLIEKT